MLIRVDLPAPFSPTMPVMAPLAMASDTPRTACTLPNDLWIAAKLDRRGAVGRHASVRHGMARRRRPHLQALLLM